MKPRRATILLTAALLASASFAGAADMNPRLAPLAPLLGKTWRGTVSPPGAAKPAVDVSRFELALNGQAVRNRHSIDDGAYGGETFIVWEEERQSLVYKGGAGGVAEVKAESRLLPDGRLHVKSRYLKNGQWVDGRETYYVEDPQAVVRFKE